MAITSLRRAAAISPTRGSRRTSCRQRGRSPPGGDQGRDFETFHSYIAEALGRDGWFAGLVPSGPIAGICNVQTGSVAGKVLSDIGTICKSGQPPEKVYAFLGTDMPVARRHTTIGKAQKPRRSAEALRPFASADLTRRSRADRRSPHHDHDRPSRSRRGHPREPSHGVAIPPPLRFSPAGPFAASSELGQSCCPVKHRGAPYGAESKGRFGS